MSTSVMLIICMKQYLRSIVDELDDWKDQGASVLRYGVMEKAHNGFLFVGWTKSIPFSFSTKLMEDEAFLEFVVIANVPFDSPNQQ